MHKYFKKFLFNLIILDVIYLGYCCLQKNSNLIIGCLSVLILLLVILLWYNNKEIQACINWLRFGATKGEEPTLSYQNMELISYIKRMLKQYGRNNKKYIQKLELLLKAFRSTPNGIILLDQQHRIEWLNDKAIEHFSLNDEKDIQQHVTNLIRIPEFIKYLADEDREENIIIQNNKKLKLLLKLIPYDKNRCFLLSVDITEREKAYQIKKAFIDNVSHELKTPLTVISGFLESMQIHQMSAQDTTESLAIIQEQVNYMTALVNDLLVLANLEKEIKVDLNHWSNIDELFEKLKTIVKNLNYKQHNIEFINLNPAIIAVDEREFLGILSNVLVNAINYTPEHGQITLTWQVINQEGIMTIEDNGIGIPRNEISRVTERFYRIKNPQTQNIKGSGLGLSIVKHSMLHHEGFIDIHSQENKGTAVSLILPKKRVKLI